MHNLAVVLSWFEVLKPLLGNEMAWQQGRIALAEGFTNAVRHAHRGLPPETPILLVAQVGADELVLEIWDQGQFFDLERFVSQLPPSSRDAEGGRGLRLIYEVADQVDYRRFYGDSNRLRIVKQLQSSQMSLS
ncbi:MAG: ATP-binding protein [Synechococcales cyanobacterium RM1_1_8]|nr:ATP-binding protein [Synechococcales cyanobacterium RM1_1_8]